jgi:prepilin-type N-terminal cleavage/methylation domain-containing protein
MDQSALSNKHGYTLIEVVLALAILAIVSVALMQSSLLVIQKNSQNEMRDEAVRLGEQMMNAIRSSPAGFDVPAATPSHLDLFVESYTLPAISRIIRGGTVQYSVRKMVSWLDTSTKQITVTVNWSFKNQPYSHSVVSIVRR